MALAPYVVISTNGNRGVFSPYLDSWVRFYVTSDLSCLTSLMVENRSVDMGFSLISTTNAFEFKLLND